MDAEAAALVGLYVDQYAWASEQVKSNTASAVAAAWGGFDGWYRDDLVNEVAVESAEISRGGQQAIAGIAEQYTAMVVAVMRDEQVSVTDTRLPPVRNGADLAGVYRRPVDQYRQKVALGADPGEAQRTAVFRRDGLVFSDLLLAEREAQQAQMAAQKVKKFRRIIRPELSQSGTCGLCIAASDQIYSTRNLLPIHAPSCRCKVLPIIGDDDPGQSLNREDLDKLYAEAGSAKADDLRRTRYRVNQHGEFGPVLTKAGDKHRGPSDVKPLEQDPKRAAHMLSKAQPVLAGLEKRAAAGENVAEPLAYQRELVQRLRRIVGD